MSRLQGVNGERSGEQTLLQEAADAVVQSRAHLLLQTRVQTLNGDLSVTFKRWYPDMDIEVEVEETPAAA